MITLKKNKGLNLQIPEFTCDGNLAPHLNKYDMLKILMVIILVDLLEDLVVVKHLY